MISAEKNESIAAGGIASVDATAPVIPAVGTTSGDPEEDVAAGPGGLSFC